VTCTSLVMNRSVWDTVQIVNLGLIFYTDLSTFKHFLRRIFVTCTFLVMNRSVWDTVQIVNLGLIFYTCLEDEDPSFVKF
jgi:hypothetical protein